MQPSRKKDTSCRVIPANAPRPRQVRRETKGGRAAFRLAPPMVLVVLVLAGVFLATSTLGPPNRTAPPSSSGVPPRSTVTPSSPAAPLTPPVTGPVTTDLATVHLAGNQVISTAVAYRNTSVTLSGGNLVVASGGSLTLDNATLSISQVNTTAPVALSHGFLVQSGGQLVVKYSEILSANGSTYPAFGVVSGAARAFHADFADLGGTGSAAVAGREGLHVSAGHVVFEDDLFDHVYQVFFDGSGAVGDLVTSSAWVNSTITGGQVGWVEVAGGASWANLTYDSWSGGKDAGMLALISGPHTTLANSSLVGDASGTQQYQVYLTYDGWTDRGVDASYASVVDDTFQTANLGISDGTQFTIERDTFNHTGLWPSTGGAAAIIVVTWIGSGVGEQTRNVDIEHNTISNFTHYAIRVSQNVSNFNVSSNRIFATESTYSSAISEADGIYLIRGVNDGTVWGNHLDMTDLTQATEPTNGIVLEAQVNYVNVSANQIYNCSEVGITVQGDSGALAAPSYYLGPSAHNILYGNRIVNFHSVASQSMYSSEAIETWMWANGTRIQDNYIGGWNLVNTTNYWNGAGILTSSSEQAFTANTMAGVRFGFVFEKFDTQQELRTLGSFNRSYNTLDANVLSTVGVASVAENAKDDMGPIVNLLTGPVDSGWTLWFSGSNATLRLVNATLPSFPSTSPYRSANVHFSGPVTLANLSTAYDLAWSQWLSSAGTVRYGGFAAVLGATSGWYNITVQTYSALTGAAQWNATQSVSGTDTFVTGHGVMGTNYSLSVDSVVATQVTATGSAVSLSWTGSGTHRFAIGVVAASTGSSAPPLTAFASAKRAIGTAPLKVRFTGSASGGTTPYAYSWHFGDGNTSTTQSPTSIYGAAGTYHAVLTVTDAAGNHANATVIVWVTPAVPSPTLGAPAVGSVVGLLPSPFGSPRAPLPGAGTTGSQVIPDGVWLGGIAAASVGLVMGNAAQRRSS